VFLQANQRVAAVSSGADAKPADVLYSVGQVLRHKVYGYRAVIVGWDARCKASGQWVTSTGTAKLPHGTEQPFYRCLVDIRDRSGAQISYVAQDNVDLLVQSDFADAKQTPLDKMVIHPLLTRHFDEYRMTEGFYVPTARMLQAYPADTPGTVRRMRAVSRTDYSDSDSESETETGSSKTGRTSTLV
jgi:hemimethylated DNA binding protein